MNGAVPPLSRPSKRRLLHRIDRRRTLVLAAIVGVLAGAVAVVFQLLVAKAVELGREFASVQRVQARGSVLLVICACAALAGLAGLLTERLCPEAGGSGIPQIKGYLGGLRGLRAARVILVKLLGGVLALAAGLSLGREGPTVHLGGASGELFGRWARAPKRARKALVAAGAGAGLGAAFNAPLAGFLFVMEELKREMSPVTYGTALIGSVCAVAVTRLALGQQTSFQSVDSAPVSLSMLPAVATVGVATGVVGVVFNQAILRSLDLRKRLNLPRWGAGAIVGALAGLGMALMPNITADGHDVAQGLILYGPTTRLVAPALAALLVGKLLLTVASYGSGVPGGVFAPLLVMGGAVGVLVAAVGHALLPAATPPPGVLATIGMSSIVAASVRAPLTAVVLVMEMSGRFHLLFALLLAAFIADVCADTLHDRPLYDALLERDLATSPDAAADEEDIVEALVEPHSSLIGTRIRGLSLPPGCLVAIVERDGRAFAPNGSTPLFAGDMLTVVVSPGVDRAALAEFIEAART